MTRWREWLWIGLLIDFVLEALDIRRLSLCRSPKEELWIEATVWKGDHGTCLRPTRIAAAWAANHQHTSDAGYLEKSRFKLILDLPNTFRQGELP